jgi:hypothetical protein
MGLSSGIPPPSWRPVTEVIQMYTNLFKRFAATTAVLSVGSLAFLFGCNHHDRDCDSCDGQPQPVPHHVSVSDADYYDVAPAQNTTYEGTAVNGDVAMPQNFEGDLYFQQHRLDRGFDRDVYFRDRAAYIRAHEGEEYWRGHRAELERGWGVNVNFDRNDRDRDARFQDRSFENRNGFNRELHDIQNPPNTRTNVQPADNAAGLHNRNVNLNSTEKLESRDINAPKADMNAPKANVTAPKADISAPKTEVTAPKADISAPKADLSAPKADVSAPKTELKEEKKMELKEEKSLPTATEPADKSLKSNDQSLKSDEKTTIKSSDMKSNETTVNTSASTPADKPATSNNPGSESSDKK